LAAVNAAAFVATFALVYWLPGRLLLDLVAPDAGPEERLPLAAGLGIVLVDTSAFLLAGLLGLAGPFHVTRPFMLCVAGGWVVSLGLARLWRRGRDFSSWVARPTHTQVVVWALTAAGVAFFLVRYDADLLWEEACMVRAASAVVADTLQPDLMGVLTGGEPLSVYQSDPISGQWPGLNAFITHNQGEREGPTVLLAPALALFGIAGFRLVYALQGLLLPGLGFLLGRQVLGRDRWGLAVAILLAFGPYSIENRTFDENFMASCFGTLVLVLLTRARPRPFAAGMAMSLFLGVRHEMLPVLAFAAAHVAVTSERRLRAVGAFVAGLALLAIPYAVVHVSSVVIHNGTWFEGTFHHPLAPHSLLGIPFDLPVQLSFPFLPSPVRSPYNAYPTLIAFPLDLLRRLGLALAAFAPAGVAWMVGRRRREAWLLLAWAGWPLALVMVQSNWVEPNKMGIPATAFAAIAVLLVAGIAFAADAAVPRARRGLVLASGLAVPLAFSLAIRGYEAPRDERAFGLPMTEFATIFPPTMTRYSAETPEYVAWDRARYRPSLLPSPGGGDLEPSLLARDVARLWAELGAPWMRDYERPMPDTLDLLVRGTGVTVGPLSLMRVLQEGAPAPAPPPATPYAAPDGERYVDVALDLSSPPLLAAAPIANGAAGARPLLLDGRAAYLVSGFRASWSEHPENLVAARDRFGTVFLLIDAGEPAHVSASWPLKPERLDASRYPDLRVPLRLPEGVPIRLIEIRSYRPARWYSRWLILRGDEVWLSDPVALSPA
jgi:hypothetical protein